MLFLFCPTENSPLTMDRNTAQEAEASPGSSSPSGKSTPRRPSPYATPRLSVATHGGDDYLGREAEQRSEGDIDSASSPTVVNPSDDVDVDVDVESLLEEMKMQIQRPTTEKPTSAFTLSAEAVTPLRRRRASIKQMSAEDVTLLESKYIQGDYLEECLLIYRVRGKPYADIQALIRDRLKTEQQNADAGNSAERGREAEREQQRYRRTMRWSQEGLSFWKRVRDCTKQINVAESSEVVSMAFLTATQARMSILAVKALRRARDLVAGEPATVPFRISLPEIMELLREFVDDYLVAVAALDLLLCLAVKRRRHVSGVASFRWEKGTLRQQEIWLSDGLLLCGAVGPLIEILRHQSGEATVASKALRVIRFMCVDHKEAAILFSSIDFRHLVERALAANTSDGNVVYEACMLLSLLARHYFCCQELDDASELSAILPECLMNHARGRLCVMSICSLIVQLCAMRRRKNQKLFASAIMSGALKRCLDVQRDDSEVLGYICCSLAAMSSNLDESDNAVFLDHKLLPYLCRILSSSTASKTVQLSCLWLLEDWLPCMHESTKNKVYLLLQSLDERLTNTCSKICDQFSRCCKKYFSN